MTFRVVLGEGTPPSSFPLLMVEILLMYQNLKMYGSIVYIGSWRMHIINSRIVGWRGLV